MKKSFNILMVAMVAMLMNACQEESVFETFGSEDIVINLSDGVTRAADTSVESYVGAPFGCSNCIGYVVCKVLS